MTSRIRDVKVGDPMGFKLLEEVCGHNTLDEVLDALKLYHGDMYIVGKDNENGVNKRPHYHIHWFSVKDVKQSAMRTFRNSLAKKVPELSNACKLYTGQDLPSGDRNSWLGYAIKDTQIKVSGFSITDEMLIASQTHRQIKTLKAVHSEKKANEEKAKKQYKQKMLEYVKENLDSYEVPEKYSEKYSHGLTDYKKIHFLVIRYLKDTEREGSLKKGIIDTYEMYCCVHILHWDEYQIDNYLYNR